MSLVALKTSANSLRKAEARADGHRTKRDAEIIRLVESGAYSQQAVAEAAGVTAGYVRKVLRGAADS